MEIDYITPYHWLIITNPRAGKRSFMGQSKYVQAQFHKHGIPFIFKKTEYFGHAIDLAKEYAEMGCMNFMVMGGDGSISEVINGIFQARVEDTSRLKIALIPRGTGNDWGRFWKLKKNDKKNMSFLLKDKCKLIDIGKITYTQDNKSRKHFFINSVGFGLDATVTDLTNRLKKYLGSFTFLYTLSFLIALTRFKKYPLKIKIDEKELEVPLITMNIANGPYSGGGIRQNPFALPYDGVFDMNLVSEIKLKDAFVVVPNLFNGKINKSKIVQTFRARNIQIETTDEVLVEADGIMVNNAGKCTVSIIPAAIKMVVP